MGHGWLAGLTLSSFAMTMAPMPSDQDRNARSSLQVSASCLEQPYLEHAHKLRSKTYSQAAISFNPPCTDISQVAFWFPFHAKHQALLLISARALADAPHNSPSTALKCPNHSALLDDQPGLRSSKKELAETSHLSRSSWTPSAWELPGWPGWGEGELLRGTGRQLPRG